MNPLLSISAYVKAGDAIQVQAQLSLRYLLVWLQTPTLVIFSQRHLINSLSHCYQETWNTSKTLEARIFSTGVFQWGNYITSANDFFITTPCPDYIQYNNMHVYIILSEHILSMCPFQQQQNPQWALREIYHNSSCFLTLQSCDFPLSNCAWQDWLLITVSLNLHFSCSKNSPCQNTQCCI